MYWQIKRQKGFALLDVMIAALVLAVGTVAYIKLQNVGLQRSEETAIRFRGTQVVNSFVDMLRANPQLANNMMSAPATNQLLLQADVPDLTNANTCSAGDSGATVKLNDSSTWCNPATMQAYQINRLQQIFSDSFNVVRGGNSAPVADKVANRAVLCLAQGTGREYRVTLIWKNASRGSGFTDATVADCPDYSNGVAGAGAEAGVITIQGNDSPDRGFVDLYTWI